MAAAPGAAAGKPATPPARLSAAARGFWRLYAPIAEGRAEKSFVLGQLGQSLDGRIATATGHSHYINGPQAIDHLHRLRALVDAVVVGIGTVLADDPQLTVRRVAGPHPARVVIDPNARMPQDARLLRDDGVPVFVVQGGGRQLPGRATPIVLAMHEGHIHPADIVTALAERGFRRLLIEGGEDSLGLRGSRRPRPASSLRRAAGDRRRPHRSRSAADRPPRGGAPAGGRDLPAGGRCAVRLSLPQKMRNPPSFRHSGEGKAL